MNIDDYRAMKAQEAEQANSKPNETEQPIVPAEPVVPVVEAVVPVTETVVETPATPTTVEVDGQQLTIEELKNGFMRKSDYTKKTQEIARQRKELERLAKIEESFVANPELAQQIGYDPREIEMQRVQEQNMDLMLNQEISLLSTKYSDFNPDEVLQLAFDRNLDSLEDAYLIYKSINGQTQTNAETVQPAVVDVEAIKAEIRAELAKEFSANQNTGTIISTNSGQAPTPSEAPTLSESEKRIAKHMGLTEAEYLKWK